MKGSKNVSKCKIIYIEDFSDIDGYDIEKIMSEYLSNYIDD